MSFQLFPKDELCFSDEQRQLSIPVWRIICDNFFKVNFAFLISHCIFYDFSYCDSLRNCASQFSESCEHAVNDNVIQAQKSFKQVIGNSSANCIFQSSVSEGLDFLCFSLLQAAEQIQETSNIHKRVEDGVVNASHKVDQVYELDNILFL